MPKDVPRSLLYHIIELRSVLLSCFLYIVFGMIGSMFFSDDIFHFLMRPLSRCFASGQRIVYTSVAEPISTELKISFYSSLLFSFPFIIRKLWGFLSIGLKEKEVLFIKKYGYFSVFLFILGIVFAYCIAIPIIVEGLTSWSFSKNGMFLPKMSENVSFILILMLSFGISFQLPIVMFFLDRTNVFSMTKQRIFWREYIAIVIIISAIITPPDALSMVFMALPLIILYCVTILVF